jgi:hypothetical protein
MFELFADASVPDEGMPTAALVGVASPFALRLVFDSHADVLCMVWLAQPPGGPTNDAVALQRRRLLQTVF